MADKQMNQFTTATDGAYIYAEASNGSQVKIAKADLINAIGGIANRGYTTNLNDCKYTGLYMADNIQGGTENCPIRDSCLVVVFSIPNLYMIQICFALNSNTAKRRRVLLYLDQYNDWVDF